MRRDWSVRARMTVLAGVVMALLCTTFCALILVGAYQDATEDRADRILRVKLRVLPLLLRDRLPPVLPELGIVALQVVGPTGRVVAANSRMTGKPRMASFVPPEEFSPKGGVVCGTPKPDACVIVVGLRVHAHGDHWIIYGAEPVVPPYVHHFLLAALLGGSALLVGVTAVGTYRTVGKTLVPIEAMRAELAEITSTDPGRRVPVPEHHDEIRQLAEIVNQTLDRLEAALQRERRFAYDASHDLRSPITAMRTQVEEALLHPKEADWPATADALLDSLHRLQAIVTNLLELARVDAGGVDLGERVDLSELADSELARRVRRARVVADPQPDVVVTADRLQLARLIANLLDNAERHATSTVTVSVRREGGDAVLEVGDDGPGISPDQREYVFQRFARLEAARSKDQGGTGLGLAIARGIAERHGGTLTIEDSERGARFVARIPIRDPDETEESG
ncbi:HAMP domain-containing sensor histidine kinase [Streptosporangium sp. NPDC006930]|uniref:sensor histidine kinase n=1 Tax=Streptosporangium sp. NPDC006930 TaxID=3154783 RepID=UPI0034231A87